MYYINEQSQILLVLMETKIKNYIKNYCLWYIQHYGCSRSKLEKKLWQRINIKFDKELIEEHQEALIQYIKSFLNEVADLGFINDSEYAHSLAKGYLRKGYPLQKITLMLKSKGIKEDVIGNTLDLLQENIDENSLQKQLAINYAKKRKLGIFNQVPITDTSLEKDLKKMCQAGFSYQDSKYALTKEAS